MYTGSPEEGGGVCRVGVVYNLHIHTVEMFVLFLLSQDLYL